MKVSHLSISKVLALAAVTVASGCGRAEFTFQADGAKFGQTNPPTVCAPTDPSNPGTTQNGLAGSIKYLDGAQTTSTVTKVDDILGPGKDAGVELILNQLSLPTVRFTQGFFDPMTNAPLKKPNGDVLIEWFAIDVYSELALTDAESDGYYQLALLSDDGAVLNMNATKTLGGTVLINNDGNHPTQMGCASTGIYLKKGEPLPIRVKYYQGPREHIALTLMWRKVAAANSAKDAYCGMSGNDLFWNSATLPSTPTQKYNDLVARGWKIPAAANFLLPPDVASNPCATAN